MGRLVNEKLLPMRDKSTALRPPSSAVSQPRVPPGQRSKGTATFSRGVRASTGSSPTRPGAKSAAFCNTPSASPTTSCSSLRSITTGAATRSGARTAPARVTPAHWPPSPCCATPSSPSYPSTFPTSPTPKSTSNSTPIPLPASAFSVPLESKRKTMGRTVRRQKRPMPNWKKSVRSTAAWTRSLPSRQALDIASSPSVSIRAICG